MIRTLIGLIFLSITCIGYAEIQIVSSLNPIEKEIENSPKGTVVLLDVGGTLLDYPDAVLHPAHDAWKLAWFQKNCPNMTKEEKLAVYHIIESTIDYWKLHDAHWPQLIRQAQDHGVKVAAFTRVSMYSSFKGARTAQLLAIMQFKDDLLELSSGQLYEYAQGVIETNARLKGLALKEVLSHLSMRPGKIIFVDDRIEQINSVNDTCEELGIPCMNFHYSDFTKAPSLDEKIAHYQLSTLVNEHRWLSEDQVRSELEKLTIK